MITHMKKKSESLVLARMLQRLAPKIGARVVVEPEWKIAGQIIYPGRAGKDGTKRYFRYNTLDLNPVGASDISKDKDYANFFMKRMGYPTIPGKAFFSDSWSATIGSKRNIHAAYRYARKLGFPVIVKPNSGSQGIDVALVHNKKEFYRAMRTIFKGDKIALVQKQMHGKDYRIVVLDKKIISAYERIPLSVTGDGKSTIRQLLTKKARGFIASSRDTRINVKDPRIANKLKVEGLAFHSKPRNGERIFLLDNANLSTGGDSVDVTNDVHPEFKKLAIKLTKDMGLRLCGVDLMIEGDPIRDASASNGTSISKPPKRYWVLEINAAPGLDHYVKTGKAQQKIVEDLYFKVLKSLSRRN